jgi:putative phosphonate transport system ATP-binding protein
MTNLMSVDAQSPILRATGLNKSYGDRAALIDASFELWSGEVLAIVGESGSGKTTLLNALAARERPDSGSVEFQLKGGALTDIFTMTEAQRRLLARTDWGFVHQQAADGLRMEVSAGANVANCVPPPVTGWHALKSTPPESMTCLDIFRVVCANACRLHAT